MTTRIARYEVKKMVDHLYCNTCNIELDFLSKKYVPDLDNPALQMCLYTYQCIGCEDTHTSNIQYPKYTTEELPL